MQPPVSCQTPGPQILLYTRLCSLVGAILWGPPKELFMGTDRGSFLKSYQVDSVHTSEWSSKKVESHRFWKRKLTAAKISNESKRFNNVMLINFTQSLPRNKWFFFRAQGSLSVIEIDTTKQKERYFFKKNLIFRIY